MKVRHYQTYFQANCTILASCFLDNLLPYLVTVRVVYWSVLLKHSMCKKPHSLLLGPVLYLEAHNKPETSSVYRCSIFLGHR